MKEAGTKHDSGKLPLSIIPKEALEGMAAALAFGAKKYSMHNFKGGIEYSRIADAALRHILAYMDNQSIDPESGLSHLDHALACLGMLKYMEINKKDMDNRFNKETGRLNNE
jgi:hypothetical protein